MRRPESLELRDEIPGIDRSDMAPYEPPDVDYDEEEDPMKNTREPILGVEYAVEDAGGGQLVWNAQAALEYGGEDALERYREDPEASVFERFEIKVNAIGRVP